MASIYRNSLNEIILENSISKQWDIAVSEWDIFEVSEDVDNKSSCICGKENIKYLFSIRNRINGNILFPIGSSCIKKFGRSDLQVLTNIYEKLFKLKHKLESNEFIEFSSEFFSRRLLEFMYDNGAFTDNKYNNFNGKRDYFFLTDMFNMRSSKSGRQDAKIKAILINSIFPFLKQFLE